ncbi:MAG: D-aminoacyl-tRNA deacylase [Gammaproteobacteria bacterium]
MIGLLQRVLRAEVEVGDQTVGHIGPGILVLVGIEHKDGQAEADRLIERVLNYRVFTDKQGRMNHSLVDTAGSLLLVPQFTLAADTHKGNRPSFSTVATPAQGKHWFEYLVRRARELHSEVQTGRFGADMRVSLVNDGPVTFWLRVAPAE